MRGGVVERLSESPVRQAWLLSGWFWIGLVVYLTLTATPPQVDLGLDHADKLEHLAAYFWLMGWFAPLYSARRTRLTIAAALIAMGITLEFLQQLGGVRYLEFADMVANTAGVVTAFLASEWLSKR